VIVDQLSFGEVMTLWIQRVMDRCCWPIRLSCQWHWRPKPSLHWSLR